MITYDDIITILPASGLLTRRKLSLGGQYRKRLDNHCGNYDACVNSRLRMRTHTREAHKTQNIESSQSRLNNAQPHKSRTQLTHEIQSNDVFNLFYCQSLLLPFHQRRPSNATSSLSNACQQQCLPPLTKMLMDSRIQRLRQSSSFPPRTPSLNSTSS
jgi:hypothetical protein